MNGALHTPDLELELLKEVSVNLITDSEIDALEPVISKGFATEFVPAPRMLLGVVNEGRNIDIVFALQKLCSQITPNKPLFITIGDVNCRVSEMPKPATRERIFRKYGIVPNTLGIEDIKIYQVGVQGGESFKFAILTDRNDDIRCYTSFNSSILGTHLSLLSSEAKIIIQSIARLR